MTHAGFANRIVAVAPAVVAAVVGDVVAVVVLAAASDVAVVDVVDAGGKALDLQTGFKRENVFLEKVDFEVR